MRKLALCVLILVTPAVAQAQTGQKEDPFEALRFLEGSWEGAGEGMSGHSVVTHDYEFILAGEFLQMKTRSVFEPQEQNPDGEIHEDMGIFSFDRARNAIVLRAFYVEGFVNTYVLSATSADPGTLTFETEAVENAPTGTRARLILRRTGDAELEEEFLVSFPGKDFSCFSTNRIKKR